MHIQRFTFTPLKIQVGQDKERELLGKFIFQLFDLIAGIYALVGAAGFELANKEGLKRAIHLFSSSGRQD
jgi:hypothetical protein